MPASRPVAPTTARLTVGEAPRALRGCVVCPAPRGLSETLPRGPRDSSTPHIPEGRRTRCPVTGRVGPDQERPQPGGEDHPTRGASHRPVRFSSRAGRETAARASTAVTVPLRPRTSPERHSRGATPSPGQGGPTTARLTVRGASVVRRFGFDFRPSRGCYSSPAEPPGCIGTPSSRMTAHALPSDWAGRPRLGAGPAARRRSASSKHVAAAGRFASLSGSPDTRESQQLERRRSRRSSRGA